MKKLDKNSRYWYQAAKLISFDTVSSKSNRECAAFVATELEKLGFKTHIHEYKDAHLQVKQQVIGVIGPEVEGGLLLCGHLDTVPFADQPGWTKDALVLSEDDQNLYGRGTSDMKLFTASCLEALADFDFSKLKKPLYCIFTADEEVGCLGASHLAEELKDFLEKYPLPSSAIIGEPTSFNMINRHKGVGHFTISFLGKAWHSSRPDLGVNAICPAAKFIQEVEALNQNYAETVADANQRDFPDFAANYLHVATINGGMALNMIPEEVTLGLSYRCFPTEAPDRVYKDALEILKRNFSADEFRVSHLSDTPAMATQNHSGLESCLKSVCSAKGPNSVSFATDGGVFSKLGIQSYIWGPGLIEVAHRPDEYMPIEDFLLAPNYLKEIVLKMIC